MGLVGARMPREAVLVGSWRLNLRPLRIKEGSRNSLTRTFAVSPLVPCRRSAAEYRLFLSAPLTWCRPRHGFRLSSVVIGFAHDLAASTVGTSVVGRPGCDPRADPPFPDWVDSSEATLRLAAMLPGVHRSDVQYEWSSTLMRPAPPIRIVYLDLNHWISLAKAAVGHPDGARHVDSLGRLRQAAASGRYVFPLSATP